MLIPFTRCPRSWGLLPVGALAVALTGCASLPADRGLSGSVALAAERGLSIPAADSEDPTRDLLSHPLSAADAVTLALVNNPDTRRVAAELGLAAADVYDAGRLSNPVLGLSRLTSNDPAAMAAETSMSIAVQFTNLLFLRSRSKTAEARLAVKQHEVARAMQALAAQVERDWLAVVAAEQQRAIRQQITRAAQASADLAQRFFDAGNISRRALALEQATAVEAHLAASRSAAQVEAERAKLARSMGLSAAEDWTVVAGLTLPIAPEPALSELRSEAHQQRLDLLAAEREAAAIATAYGLARRTRLLGDIELGFERTRENDRSRTRGPSVAVELPLFNWGSGRKARAAALLEAAEARLAGLMLDVDAEITTLHARVQEQRTQVAHFHEALIPLTELIVDQMQREQNYMLIGVFELIAARREGYAVYDRYLETLRDYWQSLVALGLATGRSLLVPQGDGGIARTAVPEKPSQPPAADHSMHGQPAEPVDAPSRHQGHPGMHDVAPTAEPDMRPDVQPDGTAPAQKTHQHHHGH